MKPSRLLPKRWEAAAAPAFSLRSEWEEVLTFSRSTFLAERDLPHRAQVAVSGRLSSKQMESEEAYFSLPRQVWERTAVGALVEARQAV